MPHPPILYRSRRAVTAEAERDPQTLASLLVTAVSDFLAASAELPADHHMPSEYFQGGMALTSPGSPASIWVRYWCTDTTLPRPRGGRGRLPRTMRALALGGALGLLPSYANPATARGHTGGYDLRIRGGPRVVIRFADGRASLEEPRNTPVDCHILAEPVAFLLVFYGRTSQWGPIARPAAHLGPPTMARPALQATVLESRAHLTDALVPGAAHPSLPRSGFPTLAALRGMRARAAERLYGLCRAAALPDLALGRSSSEVIRCSALL